MTPEQRAVAEDTLRQVGVPEWRIQAALGDDRRLFVRTVVTDQALQAARFDRGAENEARRRSAVWELVDEAYRLGFVDVERRYEPDQLWTREVYSMTVLGGRAR